eukprot:Gregarina_sp_Poly_1__4424@NODE_2387_length_2197_cov_108_953991_g670_i1_p1_GENE_NODE_2387_length_2197_cov_108_953991_g670_i1NODE_2387_length_2197_cov_108_953991_g670_i1_p1_ORF_typecomplete_len454_score92_27_NODE_2387_length_2197_cov_108_953991_g670_i16071968
MQLNLVDPFYDLGHSHCRFGTCISSSDSLFLDNGADVSEPEVEATSPRPMPDPVVQVASPLPAPHGKSLSDDDFPVLESPGQAGKADQQTARIQGEIESANKHESAQKGRALPSGKWQSGLRRVKDAPDTFLREDSRGDLVASETHTQQTLEWHMQRMALECGLTHEEFEEYQRRLIDDDELQRILMETRRSSSRRAGNEGCDEETLSTDLPFELVRQLADADGLSINEWIRRQQTSLQLEATQESAGGGEETELAAPREETVPVIRLEETETAAHREETETAGLESCNSQLSYPPPPCDVSQNAAPSNTAAASAAISRVCDTADIESSVSTRTQPMISVLARKIFGLPSPANVVIEPARDADASDDDDFYANIRNAGRDLESATLSADKRTRRRLTRDFERKSIFVKNHGTSDIARHLARFGAKRAVSRITFTQSQLSLYFPCLSTWQVWEI